MGLYTLTDLLDERSATRAFAPAVERAGQAVTYRGLRDLAHESAAALAAQGVRKGDRVALLLPRSHEALGWLFGIAHLGAVAVIVHESLKQQQVGHIVRHSGARLVVADQRARKLLTGSETPVLSSEADRRTGGGPPPSPRIIGQDLAALIYTSGSTGLPKGVMVTHANLLAGARIVADYLGLTVDDRTLSLLPWSFDAGLNQVLATFWAGGTVVIASSAYAPEICRTLAAARITGLAGVPPLWESLIRRPSPFLDIELPHLRYVSNTGGSLRASTVDSIRRAHPRTQIYLMYGLTEAFRSTYLRPELIDRYPGSIGQAIPDTEIMVLNESGAPCRPGEVGELVHRGPTVTAGYWNDLQATTRVFRPHPSPVPGSTPEYVVHSGDCVRADSDGFLYYVGRMDEQFKSRGIRVNPSEIESALLHSGLLSEAVVFAEADENGEDRIIAAVVPKETDSFETGQLASYTRASLPTHQQPARFHVATEFPRTSSGKTDRATVKRRLQ
ncbi:AMP-binding protein [Streptomyces sp. NPDC087901]|uniref:AMP-binding protein n=1 Tax=Streptomyces sp. NPDC087901 TaxID=3365818 RepID=UPI0037FF99CD